MGRSAYSGPSWRPINQLMARRVLLLMADGSAGGGASHVLDLIDHAGPQVHVGLVTQRGSFLAREAAGRGVAVWPAPFFDGPREGLVPWHIRRASASFRPDLLHAHGARAAAWCTLSALDVPMVRTVHGLHVQQHHGMKALVSGALERVADRGAVATVFLTERDQRAARQRGLHRDGRRSIVIPNGVPDPIPDLAVGPSTDLAFVGRMVDAKDPLLFLDVVAALSGARAVMVGDGPLLPELRARIEAMGLSDRVVTTGNLDRAGAQRHIAASSLLVMTSRTEGQPLVALEAMALGVPVVAPDVGGIGETLGDAGVCVGIRSSAALRDAVGELLADEQRRSAMGAAAFDRFSRCFRLADFAARTYSLYDDVASARQVA